MNNIPLNKSLIIKPVDKRMRKFELVASYMCQDAVKIPAGFKTDFASIPKIFQFFWKPTGRYGFAALEHDWLYFENKKSRKECDKLFLRAMKRHKVRLITRSLLFLGVRVGGFIAYKKCEKKRDGYTKRNF